MQVEVPYGKTTLQATLADTFAQVEHILPRTVAPAPHPQATVEQALINLLGDMPPLGSGVRVAIAINDKTRPVPHDILLPPLLAMLHRRGVRAEDITFVIATGTHPVMPPQEYALILPQHIIENYRIVCHDALDDANLLHLGVTSGRTPVYINRHYMQSDVRIVVGNIEPHQFMGFSGGVKSASIGLAGKVTINHNHAMMMQPEARLGEYERNPARQDVEEIGRMIGIHIALNAILNGKRQIIEALAGNPVQVMQKAIPRVQSIYQVPVSAPYDVMIVSPGGYPKDINVYQAQKALGHASLVVREGGTIILCAACEEGTGSQAYEEWVLEGGVDSHQAVFERFRHEGFRVGPHKAYQISRDASKTRVMLISDMAPDFVRRLLLHPLPDLQTALDKALDGLQADVRIGIMPLANATIPMLA